MQNIDEFPKDLPVPVDDGACDHLPGTALPSVVLPSTGGRTVDPAQIPGWLVIYCYPMTGRPDRNLPDGWDQIPGARGCTPQSCSFRDHYRELQALNTQVFGLSTQTTDYQRGLRSDCTFRSSCWVIARSPSLKPFACRCLRSRACV